MVIETTIETAEHGAHWGVWIEACLDCATTDNHGFAYCGDCDD